jgi:uncharacterized alpha-E superfamily protein
MNKILSIHKSKPMLCRVADSLFWMSRFIERAENTARLVDVNLQLLLETSRAREDQPPSLWEPILTSTGDLELFHTLYPVAETKPVMQFLTFSRDNPSSVFSCVCSARENARMVRDQISSEMWEAINRLYLFLKEQDFDRVWRSGPYDFYKEIKEYSLLFQGITESTFPHQLGYEFIKAGKYLERGDKTGRILDSKHHLLHWGRDADVGAFDVAQWTAVLRACSALESYNQVYATEVTPLNVADLLILSWHFPRSMLFCLEQLDLAMHAISGCPRTHYSNQAERISGRLISDLKYVTTDEILRGGMHEFLDKAADEIGRIGVEFSQRYMFFPVHDPAAEVAGRTMGG